MFCQTRAGTKGVGGGGHSRAVPPQASYCAPPLRGGLNQ